MKNEIKKMLNSTQVQDNKEEAEQNLHSDQPGYCKSAAQVRSLTPGGNDSKTTELSIPASATSNFKDKSK